MSNKKRRNNSDLRIASVHWRKKLENTSLTELKSRVHFTNLWNHKEYVSALRKFVYERRFYSVQEFLVQEDGVDLFALCSQFFGELVFMYYLYVKNNYIYKNLYCRSQERLQDISNIYK